MLVRDDFRGKSFFNAIIDLPFALPTIVASIVLLSLYGPRSPIGLHLYATQPVLIIALAFVTLPFVVRSVQPVLEEVDREAEEAAASLGANGWTIFRRIILPALYPALLGGAGLAFARAVGEFGSVVLIGGGIPRETEVASQYIAKQIEIDRPASAAAVSVALLLISFAVLFALRLVTQAQGADVRIALRTAALDLPQRARARPAGDDPLPHVRGRDRCVHRERHHPRGDLRDQHEPDDRCDRRAAERDLRARHGARARPRPASRARACCRRSSTSRSRSRR